ncbi:hypothetical protein BDV96DRAFT_107488 [Lophiotrema nucula]|uniref:Uncharacterized protein n=1 Tax=Lophiotrema nucula TaxID=690887 RepID=A0A6A5Z3Q4_9PLEO|nr:hypothetical protein BDV96DRAFT_107488 [Lophiotrema nucula]
MFHRRRATSNPASKAPPSSAALLAAGKVFPQNREPNVPLSSAAAAAALRTHTTSPTPVGDTVTKRMVRRGSVSSGGSNSAQQPGLLRRSSSGSMTERSFREHDAPPVPTVPKDPPSVGVVHRRASSLEPQYRVGSPVGRGGGRGVSLDRGGYAQNPGRGQGQGMRVNTLAQVPEAEQQQDGSPRNVNFSRPMSPQAQTPSPPSKAPASARGGHGGWFTGPVVNSEATFRGGKTRPKTSDGVSAYQLHNAQQAVQNAADKPVSKRSPAHGVEGTRLATGSMRAKPSGTSVQSFQPPVRRSTPQPVDPKSPYAVFDPSTRTFVHKQEAMQRFRALDDADEEGPSTQHYVQQHAQPSPRQPRVQQRQPSPVRFIPVAPRSPTPPPQREESPVRYERQASPVEMPAEEERTSTEPVTRTHGSAMLARRNSEDYAEADLHAPRELEAPSAVKTTRTGHLHEEQPDSPLSPKAAPNQDGPYPRIASTPPPAQSTTQTFAGKGRGSDRNSSLSPPRNAHFAAVAVEFPNGVMHQPPPRSVSPAKSALKASPSVSRRNSSPLAGQGRTSVRGAPSEASDTVSDDGFRKKKRQVRVSFEEEPVIAGSSAYPEVQSPTSPTGLGASRWSPAKEEQKLDDVMKPMPVLPSFGSIRDRNRRQDERDVPEKVTETVSSSLSTSVGSIGEPMEVSSDHVVGGILAQDFASKSILKPSSNEPLPPEVTTVEGSGYASDSDQSDIPQEESIRAIDQSNEIRKETQPSIPKLEPKTLTTPHESKPEAPEVPIIAIQPASPSPTEKPAPRFPRPFVPGGWDYDEESDQEVNEVAKQPVEVEPAPSAINTAPAVSTIPQIAPLTSANLPQDDSSSDDNSSIYSDAYEEITDDEAGGFGSIDAMVESPAISAAPSGLMFSKHADAAPVEASKSKLRQEHVPEASASEASQTSQDWDAAQQHWKGLSSSRQQNPVEQRTTVHAVTTEAPTAPVTKPTTKPAKSQQPKLAAERKARVAVAPTDPEPIPTKSPRRNGEARQLQQSAPQPPSQPRKSAMKKPATAVHPPAAPPQMRKTMRADGSRPGPTTQVAPETHMRQSMRGSPPTGASRGPAGLAASRHSMPPADTRPQKGALQKKHIPAMAVPQPRPQSDSGPLTKKPAATKPVAPAPTYDDDSDASASSFRRERPRSTSRGDTGHYTMRSSMRGGPAPTMRTAPAARPMSPLQPPSSPPPTLRKSLRPSSPTPERTTAAPAGGKSSRFSIRSLSPAGRFRGSKFTPDDAPPLPPVIAPKQKTPMFGKAPKAKAPVAPAPKSRFKSRFAADSDDSDDERPARFQSRFADSDDEDEDFELPQGLTPVRGIPRKPGEEDGDSTDLEEEASDGESPAKLAAKDVEKGGKSLTNGNATGQGGSLAAGSLRDSKHAPLPTFEVEGAKKSKKRGFFGLGKKKESTPASTETALEAQRTTSNDIPLPPQHTDRTQRPLSAIDEDKAMEPSSPGRRTPKLQRRSTPEWGRSTSDSWPLPQPPMIGEEQARPQSSDGIIPRRTSLRPTLQKRNSAMSESRTAIDPKTGKEVVIGKSGKKKKFQGLRRVFGLDD